MTETKESKRPWINLNPKNVVIGTVACLLLGFVAGKIYTWDSIIVDCKVLGSFRIGNTPFHCKILTPPTQ